MNYKKGFWITKDNKKINIKDMETSHIKNAIKYLQKNNNFYDIGFGSGVDADDCDYMNNTYLVYKKIEELQCELEKRDNTSDKIVIEYEL